MRKPTDALNRIFRPEVSPEVTESLDRENLENMFHLSEVICCFEAVLLAVWLLIPRVFDRTAIISLVSVSYCIIVCVIFSFISSRLRKRSEISHQLIVFLTVLYYVFLMLWAVFVSRRHYLTGDDKFLTFFTVLLCFVSFITFRPVISIPLSLLTFTGLYWTVYAIDGAVSVNIYNYIVLTIVTITCFVLRYGQSIRASENRLTLKQNYETLHYLSRHDALTGALNRQSFAEDTEHYFNTPITVVMTDIDYFKQFNDRYGHTVGDEVLRDACSFLKTLFPDGSTYRYGGDEFLIMLEGQRADETKRICTENPGFPKHVDGTTLSVRLGHGVASGIAADADELTKLIAEADQFLYEMKRETHKNDER